MPVDLRHGHVALVEDARASPSGSSRAACRRSPGRHVQVARVVLDPRHHPISRTSRGRTWCACAGAAPRAACSRVRDRQPLRELHLDGLDRHASAPPARRSATPGRSRSSSLSSTSSPVTGSTREMRSTCRRTTRCGTPGLLVRRHDLDRVAPDAELPAHERPVLRSYWMSTRRSGCGLAVVRLALCTPGSALVLLGRAQPVDRGHAAPRSRCRGGSGAPRSPSGAAARSRRRSTRPSRCTCRSREGKPRAGSSRSRDEVLHRFFGKISRNSSASCAPSDPFGAMPSVGLFTSAMSPAMVDVLPVPGRPGASGTGPPPGPPRPAARSPSADPPPARIRHRQLELGPHA